MTDKCAGCEKAIPTIYCVECGVKYCIDCDAGVHKMANFRTHKRKNVTELSADETPLRFKWTSRDCPNAATFPETSICATKTSGYQFWNATVVGDTEISAKGMYVWAVKVTHSAEGYIMVGVAPSTINVNNADNHENEGWYFYCLNGTLYSGAPQKYVCQEYVPGYVGAQPGDIVTVKVVVPADGAPAKVSFQVNGKDFGVAFEEIPTKTPLVPAVLFYTPKDSVQIINV